MLSVFLGGGAALLKRHVGAFAYFYFKRDFGNVLICQHPLCPAGTAPAFLKQADFPRTKNTGNILTVQEIKVSIWHLLRKKCIKSMCMSSAYLPLDMFGSALDAFS